MSSGANTLYYGDNLDVLRQHIKDESVDLIYLDPPFNSNADYNVLFSTQEGNRSAAQIKAFSDTWRWDEAAARAFRETVEEGGDVSRTMQAFRTILGESNMLAYLSMMAPRLVELWRVLKPTGSLYLHCDPTASHYLKILLDAIFGPRQFRNEVIWLRHNARKTEGRWPRVHDTLLFCTKSNHFTFNPLQVQANEAKLPHTLITGADGKKYQTYELTAPGVTQKGESGQPWRGFDPSDMGRHWANNHTVMDAWDAQGLIHWPKKGGFPRRRDDKPFVPEARMVAVSDVWTDIDRINQSAKERLGYPTQKPLALLERIINASSNPGDVVLDPFCGCGTTIEAAQYLRRRWVGIDVTYLATHLIKSRLRDAFGDEATFRVVGEPTTLEEAMELGRTDPYQFQFWALGLVGARSAEEKKGADKGIDGRLYFHEAPTGPTKQVIFSVKAGKVQPQHLRDLRGVLDREGAQIGVLISLQEPTPAMKSEAASGDFYTSPWGSYPRLQLRTIEELLNGKGVEMPPIAHTNATFKRARYAHPQFEQGTF